MQYKNELINELIDTICNNDDYIIQFLDIYEDSKLKIEEEIAAMDDNEFTDIWNTYHDYQSIEETILEYEEELEYEKENEGLL